MSAAIAFLLALLQAAPAVEKLARAALAQLDAQRERDAAQRLQDKDAHVDAAIREVTTP